MKKLLNDMPPWAMVAMMIVITALLITGAVMLLKFIWKRKHKRDEERQRLSPEEVTKLEDRNKKLFIFWSVAINLAVFIAGFPLLLLDVGSGKWLNAGWLLWGLQALHFGFSWDTTPLNRLTGLMFLGHALFEIPPAKLFYRPWLLSWTEEVESVAISREFPGNPEDIDKSGDDKNPRPGKMQPIRVTTGSYKSVTEGSDPELSRRAKAIGRDVLNDQATPEVRSLLTIRVRGGMFFQFKMTTETIDAAFQRLRDHAEYILKAEFAKRTPILIIEDWTKISEEVLSALEVMIGERPANPNKKDYHRPPEAPWGLALEEHRITDIDMGETINRALANLRKSEADKQATIVTSEGEQQKRINEGKGDEEQLAAQGRGRAAALQAEAEVFTQHPTFATETMRNKTIREVLANQAKTVVLGGGGGVEGLMNVLVGANEILKGTANTASGTPPAPAPATQNPGGSQ